jgi:site-specific recombinase XerD
MGRGTPPTMLLEAGVPMRVVQELLGHNSITVTSDIYSDVRPALAREAADSLAEYLGRAQ